MIQRKKKQKKECIQKINSNIVFSKSWNLICNIVIRVRDNSRIYLLTTEPGVRRNDYIYIIPLVACRHHGNVCLFITRPKFISPYSALRENWTCNLFRNEHKALTNVLRPRTHNSKQNMYTYRCTVFKQVQQTLLIFVSSKFNIIPNEFIFKSIHVPSNFNVINNLSLIYY